MGTGPRFFLSTMLFQMRVAIIGQGYVGLTITSGALSAGFEVLGVDKNQSVVEGLNSGKSHIEGISDEQIAQGVAEKRFRASNNFEKIEGSEVIVIAVPTPLDHKGNPDLALVESASDSIANFLSENTLVINESTSYAGTLRNVIAARIRAINPKVRHFAVSPERVDPGNMNYGIKNTPRLVGGLTDEAIDRAVSFYSAFCDHVVKVSSPEVAESAKLLENSFRFINIGFINEFAQLMNTMNIPVSEVISAAATKPYGFMPFFPNVGIGGHCIPVDPLYLQKSAKDYGVESRYIKLSEELNHEMPRYSVDRLDEISGGIKGKHCLVVGVSYKADISDTRESPAQSVIDHLRKKGARVSWHDPLVASFDGDTSSPVVGDYDLALVLVKHQSLDLSNWQGKRIYCVNAIVSEPDWIPILGSRNSH
jgi:UDP-N-acetyl-D-glucosamine dehydrogenase